MKKPFTLASLVSLLLSATLWSGCLDLASLLPGGEKKPADPHATAKEATAPAEESSGEAEEEASATPQDPAMAALPYEELEIQTPDRVQLYARLYDPSQKPEDEAEEAAPETNEEAPVLKYPTVILLHDLNGSLSAWGNLPAALVKQGYAVIALDQRGHGQSTRRAGRKKRSVAWRLFEPDDWQHLPKDVHSILTFFKESAEDYPQVDISRVGLVGAGIGANTALIAANVDPRVVKTAVLLSPSYNFKGLSTTDPIIHYPNALFFVASQADGASFQDTERLYKWGIGPKAIQLYRDVPGGTEMLRQQPALKSDILNWLGKHLPPQAIPVPVTSETPEP